MSNRDENVKIVEKNLSSYPDFPRPGILFHDIFSILRNPEAAYALNKIILEDIASLAGKISAVGALDSRGFLFGPQIAMHLNVPFIPIRKKGKLPGEVINQKFELEYGSDELEVQKDSIKSGSVLLVDDLLATGGSLKAAGQLIERLGYKVELCFVIMEIVPLQGRKNIPYKVHSILHC